MAQMTVQYWKDVLTANGINPVPLTINDIQYQALGLLGYASGTLNDRLRAFYRDRTSIDDLTTAQARNVNDKGVQ